jgi:glucosyl-3-phosphoglycerate synthase
VDIVERFGIAAIAQVDLGVREHRNRTLAELGPQANAILITALRRAGLLAERPGHQELLRFDANAEPEAIAVEVRERPPIISVPGYRRNHGHELTA